MNKLLLIIEEYIEYLLENDYDVSKVENVLFDLIEVNKELKNPQIEELIHYIVNQIEEISEEFDPETHYDIEKY